ncbi:6PF2K-domain-containing protein [Linderina pennispora]|uniref:6PF2K-domain-containing protein n=1 Tax=Linderina pennispora TaxID=61395 RepID=A0A1Y1W575_9FUNG|nr:6PF2K-domain-containing protein [Linderina pennispora]ORX68689.1 6PF2K-domain-containing protein [Linderina pennispora]
MAAQLYKTHTGQLFHAGSIVIINVGLPARGKTHGSRSLIRYMNWLGVKSKSFHMGQYRRRLYGPDISAEYFDLGNDGMTEKRSHAEDSCIDDIIEYLTVGSGQLAIFDASNLRADRRRYIYERFESKQIRPLFVEYICENDRIVEENIRKVKITSPDYVTMDADTAVRDFKARIKRMEPYYQTIEDGDLSYIKLYNVGEHIVVNNIRGYLQSRVVFYLMNLHISDRTIYLARSGESSNEGSGIRYAKHLHDAILRRTKERAAETLKKTGVDNSNKMLKVWTSTHVKSYQTAEYFVKYDNFPVRRRMLLKGLNPGICENLTLAEVKDKFPDEYHAYLRDPSYHDVSVRLEPVILELEREHDDLLIIAPESVLRCIYAYFAPKGLPDSLDSDAGERRVGISPSDENLRKTKTSAADWDEPAAEPSTKPEVPLDDLVEFRQYRQRHRGIDTEALAKGDPSQADGDDGEKKAPMLDSAFAAETNTVDVNKHMMAGNPTAQAEPDAEDDLYQMPEHLKVVEEKPVSEGNVAMASTMLTSIPEETESLVARMSSERSRDNSRVLGAVGSAVRYKKVHDPSERSSKATDDITMQKFKKRMRR